MNVVILIGRTTRDIELKYSQNQTAIARFSIAIDRGKDKGTDFINCTAFGRTAENMRKYVKKGDQVSLRGHISTGSYTNKEGKKVYTTEIIADAVEFIEPRKEKKNDEFIPMGEDLPFN